MVGFATNPNVFGVVVVGLGCEKVAAEHVASDIASFGQTVELVVIQKKAVPPERFKRYQDRYNASRGGPKVKAESVPVSSLV